ncbi:MAG: hypothetical protein II597_10590, partial [Prevotella sp.]|nr:hypothetical protein [Prevotella sp.]
MGGSLSSKNQNAEERRARQTHPSDSYHAYDVTDYFSVNPLYGTEQDFKDLIDAAHAKGIKIYMDYVLNHSGKGNAWFKEALADPSSPYRD